VRPTRASWSGAATPRRWGVLACPRPCSARRRVGPKWLQRRRVGPSGAAEGRGVGRPRSPPPPPPHPHRTKWTPRVPHPVLIGHTASLTPYCLTVGRPRSPAERARGAGRGRGRGRGLHFVEGAAHALVKLVDPAPRLVWVRASADACAPGAAPSASSPAPPPPRGGCGPRAAPKRRGRARAGGRRGARRRGTHPSRSILQWRCIPRGGRAPRRGGTCIALSGH
jgi:hypothetical protein